MSSIIFRITWNTWFDIFYLNNHVFSLYFLSSEIDLKICKVCFSHWGIENSHFIVPIYLYMCIFFSVIVQNFVFKYKEMFLFYILLYKCQKSPIEKKDAKNICKTSLLNYTLSQRISEIRNGQLQQFIIVLKVAKTLLFNKLSNWYEAQLLFYLWFKLINMHKKYTSSFIVFLCFGKMYIC